MAPTKQKKSAPGDFDKHGSCFTATHQFPPDPVIVMVSADEDTS